MNKNCALIGSVVIVVLCIGAPVLAQTTSKPERYVDGKGVGEDSLPKPPKIYEIADLAMWPTGPCDLSEPRLHKLFSSVIPPRRREDYAGCMQSCTEVIADASLPFELRRKAQFSRIYMLANTAPPKAVEEGQQWLAEHPDDRDALMLRCVVFLASRLDMQPLGRITAAFHDLETNHPLTEWNVITNRLLYAQSLQQYANFHLSNSIRQEAMSQLLLAREAVLNKQEDPATMSFDRQACGAYLKIIDKRISPKSSPKDPSEEAAIREAEKRHIQSLVDGGLFREVKKPDGTVTYEAVPGALKPSKTPKPTLEDIKKWYPLTSEDAQKEAGTK